MPEIQHSIHTIPENLKLHSAFSTVEYPPIHDQKNKHFRPNAARLRNARLDEYISSLPPASFINWTQLLPPQEKIYVEQHGLEKNFAPFYRMPKSITVDELKATAAENGSGFQSSLMSAISANATRITKGIRFFLRLELIRDFLQFIGLFLSTFVGDLGSTVKSIFKYVSNIFSLQLANIFDRGFLYLIILFVLCFSLLMVFLALQRKDPRSGDSHGLESRVWGLRGRFIRRRNMFIVFVLTTLYLPLSAISISALVWEDTFWPIPNPYKVSGKDEDFRYCYRTNVNESNTNYAWLVILIAALVLLLLTIYFPFLLRKLVTENKPIVPHYDENGEKVKDFEQHYQKILDNDACPYMFLYSGKNL